MKIKINYLPTETRKNETVLHCHYDGQTSRQNCFISLDCESGEVNADYNAEIGNAVPFDVWHMRTHRFAIPCMTATAVNNLMDAISVDLQVMQDGYDEFYDGNNYVGRLNDDARESEERIEKRCAHIYDGCIEEYEAGDWFQDDPPAVTADMTDDQLEAIAEEAEDQAWGEGIVLNGTLGYLESLRENEIEELEEA